MSAELLARFYDLTHRGNPGDLGFYRAACAGRASVLELGCGSGRVLADLPVPTRMGLDRDPALLRLARERCAAQERPPHWLRGDMACFALGRSFERILVPYNGLYCLLDEERVGQCLRMIAAHLAPGGRLVFDVYGADAFNAGGAAEDPSDPSGGAGPVEDAGQPEDAGPVVSFEYEGEVVDVWETSQSTRETQRLDVVYEYRTRSGVRLAEVALPQRYWLARELPALLADAGLQLEALHDDPAAPPCELADLEGSDWIGVVAAAT